jgi:hypothetical protein
MSRELTGREEGQAGLGDYRLNPAVSATQRRGQDQDSNLSDQLDHFSYFIYNSPETIMSRESGEMAGRASTQAELLNDIFSDMDPQTSYRDEDLDFFNFLDNPNDLGAVGVTDTQPADQATSMALHNTPSVAIPGFPPLIPDMHPGIVIPAHIPSDNALQQQGRTPIQPSVQLSTQPQPPIMTTQTQAQLSLGSPSYNPFQFPQPPVSNISTTQPRLQLDPFSQWTFDPTSLDPLDSPFSDSTPTTEFPLQPSKPTSPTISIRRKNSLPSNSDTPSTSNPLLRPTKTSHNMIEKRYRLKLNDKILSLRNAVPALRGQSPDAVVPGKLNKGTVLSKATEYIKQLEQEKSDLEREVERLRTELESQKGFEWGGVANVVVNEHGMISPESCTSVMSPPEGEGMLFGEVHTLRPRKRVKV